MDIDYINISIIRNKKIIGNCDFLSISKSTDEILIFNLNPIEEIKSGDKLTFSILLNTYYLMKLDILILEILKKDKKELACKIKYYSNSDYNFNQLYLNIFNEWRLKTKIDWKTLRSVKEKQAWIRCCGILNGVPQSIKLKKKYVLDANLVKHPIDLHCLFGDLFMGNRGYFGSEYNAFVDCLTSVGLDRSLRKINSKFVISNYNLLNETISKYKGYQGYVDAIIEQLKISGFTIEIS